MASADKPNPFSAPLEKGYTPAYARTRKLVFLAMLTSIAVVLHLVELSLPNPTPWLRLGLANIITLSVLAIYGLGEGLLVGMLRILLGSFISGNLLGPTFLLALSGGLGSILAMWLTLHTAGRYFSLVGVSLIGAYVHTLIQLGVAYWVLIRHVGIFSLLPIFLGMALITGFLNGLGALILTRHLWRLTQ
jgi:heptaprenyl diphosphate synthase